MTCEGRPRRLLWISLIRSPRSILPETITLKGRMEELERRQRETATVMIAGAALIQGRIAELGRQQAETQDPARGRGPPRDGCEGVCIRARIAR